MAYTKKRFDFILTINQHQFKIFKSVADELSELLHSYISSNPISSNYVCEIPSLNKNHYNLINLLFKDKNVTISDENFDFLDKIENFFQIKKLRIQLDTYQRDFDDFLNDETPETFQDLIYFEQDLFDFKNDKCYDEIIQNFQERRKFFTNEVLMVFLFNCCISRPKFIDFMIDENLFVNDFITFINSKYQKSNNNNDDENEEQNINDDQEYLFVSSFLIEKKLNENGLLAFNIFKNYEKNSIDHFLSNLIREDNVEQLQQFLISNPSYMNFHFLHIYNCCNELDNYCDLMKYSAFFGSLKCFKYLLLNHYETKSDVFLYSIAGGNNEIIRISETKMKTLKNNLQSIEKVIEKSVIIAIIYHRYQVLEWILSSFTINFNEKEYIDFVINTCIKYTNFSSFDLFVNNGIVNLSQFLLKNFQNFLLKSMNVFDFWIIHVFLMISKKDSRQVLLTKNLKNGLSPLSYACEINCSYLFEILFDFNECQTLNLLERKNSEGKIPIEVAIEKGNCEIIKLLLRLKVYQEKTIKNSKINLISYACKCKEQEIVKLIINEYNKVDVKITEKLLKKYDKSGVHIIFFYNTPFLLACQLNCIEIVNLLLNLNDDVNQKNSIDKKTGLHIACQNNSSDLVQLLLMNKKIKLNEVDSNGLTPSDYAKINDNNDIIQLLEEKK